MYLVHRLAHTDLRRFMKNYVDAVERLIDDLAIANITLHEFSRWIQVRRLGIFPMYLRHERIKNSYAIPALDERIHEVRTDKTGATSNQYVSFSHL